MSGGDGDSDGYGGGNVCVCVPKEVIFIGNNILSEERIKFSFWSGCLGRRPAKKT